MEVQSSHAASPQHSSDVKNVAVPEENPKPKQACTQEQLSNYELTPLEEQVASSNKPFRPTILPYSHANHPAPLTEGTGLYCSPFHGQDVSRSVIDSQGCTAFTDESDHNNAPAILNTKDQDAMLDAQQSQPLLQASLLLPEQDDSKDPTAPVAVNENGPVFLETRNINQENKADRPGGNHDLLRSLSPADETVINPALDENIAQNFHAQKDNSFTDSRVGNTLNSAPLFAIPDHVIGRKTNNVGGADKVINENWNIDSPKGNANQGPANALSGKMTNVHEVHDLSLGNTVTPATVEATVEIRGRPIDYFGGAEVLSYGVRSDEHATVEEETLKFPKNNHDKEERGDSRLRGFSSAIAEPTKAFRGSNVVRNMSESAERIDVSSENTKCIDDPKVQGPEHMNVDDRRARRATATTPDVDHAVNPMQASPVRKEYTAIRLSPLDFLPESSSRLTTTNTLAPITGGSPTPILQDYSSVPGKELSVAVRPVLQSNTPSLPWISAQSNGNATLSLSPPFNPATEQAADLLNRPQIKSADPPLPFDSNMTGQFFCVGEDHGILHGPSSASSMHQPSDLSTREGPLHCQNYCPECAEFGAQNSVVPTRGRPPTHKHPEIYRLPATIVQASSTNGGYDEKSPIISPLNTLGTTVSFHGLRHDHFHGSSPSHEGKRVSKYRSELPQRIPESVRKTIISDESRARVIEHPPVSNVKKSKCPYCSKLFKTDKDKQRHVQRMHVLKGRYPCSYASCKQSFAEAHKLSRHVRTVHLMNRPFKCPHCDSAFGERGNMMQHVRKAHLEHGKNAKRMRRS